MNHTIGTCSNCGGRVVLSAHWMSVKPEIPHCESCGARAAQPHGPVIPMEKPELPAHFNDAWGIIAAGKDSTRQHPFRTPPVYDPLQRYRRS